MGRPAKRNKVHAMAYLPRFDALITGGTDRFINVFSEGATTGRYRCITKSAKQGPTSVINAMCCLDHDKVILGQSDEFLRLCQLTNDDLMPIATFKFEDSGINNLCSLNDQNLFISSGFNRSISVWDIRQT